MHFPEVLIFNVRGLQLQPSVTTVIPPVVAFSVFPTHDLLDEARFCI